MQHTAKSNFGSQILAGCSETNCLWFVTRIFNQRLWCTSDAAMYDWKVGKLSLSTYLLRHFNLHFPTFVLPVTSCAEINIYQSDYTVYRKCFCRHLLKTVFIMYKYAGYDDLLYEDNTYRYELSYFFQKMQKTNFWRKKTFILVSFKQVKDKK